MEDKDKKIIVPSYYKEFKCIDVKCTHSCCENWEVDIDEMSLNRYKNYPEIMKLIKPNLREPQFIIKENKKCSFLRDDGLCQMIIDYGETMLCDVCSDHPRFRNFWSDRIEMGIAPVCEEAGRIILNSKEPLHLVQRISDNKYVEFRDDRSLLDDDEKYLIEFRDELLRRIEVKGPYARILEYLIYRHIPNALYYDDLEERVEYIQNAYDVILDKYETRDQTIENLVQCFREYSYDAEYQ